MFIAALFVIVKYCKQPQCPLEAGALWFHLIVEFCTSATMSEPELHIAV